MKTNISLDSHIYISVPLNDQFDRFQVGQKPSNTAQETKFSIKDFSCKWKTSFFCAMKEQLSIV